MTELFRAKATRGIALARKTTAGHMAMRAEFLIDDSKAGIDRKA
jgi:hypothetical protein